MLRRRMSGSRVKRRSMEGAGWPGAWKDGSGSGRVGPLAEKGTRTSPSQVGPCCLCPRWSWLTRARTPVSTEAQSCTCSESLSQVSPSWNEVARSAVFDISGICVQVLKSQQINVFINSTGSPSLWNISDCVAFWWAIGHFNRGCAWEIKKKVGGRLARGLYLKKKSVCKGFTFLFSLFLKSLLLITFLWK